MARIAQVEQVSFGILTWTVSGEIAPDEAVVDVREACLRVVGDTFNSAAETPGREGTTGSRHRD